MQGFVRAVERGCTMVECDIRQAADGVLVLSHDPHVTDVQNKRYKIAEHSSAELHSLNLGAGEGVPTLDELVAWSQGRCAIMADMKCEDNGIEAQVVRALAPLATDAKLVPGAGEASRRRFRALDPQLHLSLSLGNSASSLLEGSRFDAFVETIDTYAVTWEHSLLNASRIQKLHARGLKVFAWTVDDISIMQRLINDRVDGIISNRSDLLESL